MTRAGRFGARFLLLMTAALTAYAAQQPVPIEGAAWFSVRLVHFIFGAIGASLMVTTKPLGWWETFATLAAGVGVAILATPLTMDRFGMHSPAEEIAIAGAYGLSGIYLVRAARALLQGFARDPLNTLFAAIDRWRGIQRPAAPPIDDTKEARP